jgi:hypothetical protein
VLHCYNYNCRETGIDVILVQSKSARGRVQGGRTDLTTRFPLIWKLEKGVLRDKDHVRAERVHVCMTAHGRVSAEETLLLGTGQDRQARYDGGGIPVMVKTNSTGL